MANDEAWMWHDPRWHERTGDEPAALLNEAVRRAVDLRDALAAERNPLTTRAVFLINVLNHLAATVGDTSPD